jgi:hypothetical protein
MKKDEGLNITYNFVLITTIPEYEYKVNNWLLDHPLFTELKPLFRENDLITKVKIDSRGKLGVFILNKIRHIEGVVDTKTLQ